MKKHLPYLAFVYIVFVTLMIVSCAPPTTSPSQSELSYAPSTPPAPISEPTTEPVSPPAPTPSYKTVRVEETDPSFQFSKGWMKEAEKRASGGSWIMTFRGCEGVSYPNVDIKFSGTGISIIHVIAPFCGIIDVKIDGQDYPSIDTYSANPQIKNTSITKDLAHGDHIITISPSGESNPAADPNTALGSPPPALLIYIDAIEIIVPE